MIEPTRDDIGRQVIYIGNPGYEQPLTGRLTGFYGNVVLVRFPDRTTSAALLRDHLDWVADK